MGPRPGTVLALAIALSAPLAYADTTAPPAVTRAAQDLYTAGRESYHAALYGRALEEFERSLALASSPNTRLYIARSLRELGRWSEAAEQYRATVREAEEKGARYAATREAGQVELRDVEARLARATSPGETEPPVPPPPPVKVEISAPSVPVAASPEAAPARGPRPTMLTWITGGAAVVGFAASGVLYGVASDRYSYLEDNCRSARNAACDDARTSGERDETVAYVFLGVATALAAVSVVSLFTSSAPPSRVSKEARRWPLAF
jgi:hypothetical protein